jgi:molecular chaperone DnaJ
MSEDFYSVLGVGEDADEDDIKKAYRKKAAEYHPDVSDDPDAEEKFKRIKRAKEVLTDDEKRRMYDRMGHEQFVQAQKRGGVGGGAGGAGRAGGRGRAGAGGQGPFGGAAGAGQDPFGGGGLGDLFEQFFGGGSGRGGGGGGADLQTTMSVTLEEAHQGTTKQLNFTRPSTCPDCEGRGHPETADAQTCPECNGRGEVTRVQQTPFGRVQQRAACQRCEGAGRVYDERCPTCGGDGTVRREVTVEVDVPPGIQDGQRLKIGGEGAAGERGQRSGDLVVEFDVEEHEEFERDGADLYSSLSLSFPQAVFGDTVEVPTLDGSEELDVPPGTQPGKRFRIRNAGMPKLGRGGRVHGQGDLYVVAQVVTPDPDDLNEEQREALEAFSAAGGEEIEPAGEGFFERLRNSL